MPKPKKQESVSGEHIFPASQITPLAVKWKELNAAGQHEQAMLILEDIVKLSTSMFERLAQHEDFHHTVDLSILVSAAQEKVIKWLLRWNPKKGRIFSWFSCHEHTPIQLENGSFRTIGELVNERYSGKVACWNQQYDELEFKQVIGWSKEPCEREEWCKLSVRDHVGNSNQVYITNGHLVLTDTGWTPVDWLNPRDVLFTLVEERLEPVEHKLCVDPGMPSWEIEKAFRTKEQGEGFNDQDSYEWKYDLTVEGNENFFAGNCKLLIHNSKCAKHAFLSELVKVNQYRKRYHVTGDNLEKYFGQEDHESDRHNLAEEFNSRLKTLYCYWGSLQERGAIRYLVDCVVDLDNHDKQSAIRGSAYAYGISIDLAKFFYNFVLVSLRDLHYDKIRVSLSESDLLRMQQAYSTFMFLMEEFATDKIKRFVAVYGGQRFKVPTIQQIIKLRDDHRMFEEIDKSDKDPDSINEIARKYKKTPRTASEIYQEMAEVLNPQRVGEFSVYSDDPYE